MKQQLLFKHEVQSAFGGSLLRKGKRKTARPIPLRAPVHIVLKADRTLQLFRSSALIKNQIRNLSQKFGVKVYSLAVHEDHVHGVIKLPSRILYRAWIRALTGTLCRQIKGLKWRLRPFTKILSWGKQFKGALAYLKANCDEAEFLKLAWDRFGQFENEMRLALRCCQEPEGSIALGAEVSFGESILKNKPL